jgi:hypothetical protein
MTCNLWMCPGRHVLVLLLLPKSDICSIMFAELHLFPCQICLLAPHSCTNIYLFLPATAVSHEEWLSDGNWYRVIVHMGYLFHEKWYYVQSNITEAHNICRCVLNKIKQWNGGSHSSHLEWPFYIRHENICIPFCKFPTNITILPGHCLMSLKVTIPYSTKENEKLLFLPVTSPVCQKFFLLGFPHSSPHYPRTTQGNIFIYFNFHSDSIRNDKTIDNYQWHTDKTIICLIHDSYMVIMTQLESMYMNDSQKG